MPKLKLTYFDLDGGRGEPVRLALTYANIPFEDYRFGMEQWPEVRDQTPLLQVPVLEIDGKQITQTNSMLRYVGKLAGLYPENALEALHCDETMGIVEDGMGRIVPTLFMQDEDEKRQAREALAAGPIPLYLRRLEAILKQRGGRYFAGDRLSVADLKVFLWTRYLQSGILDHVPVDIVKNNTPALVEHFERVNSVPQIKAYYDKRAAS